MKSIQTIYKNITLQVEDNAIEPCCLDSNTSNSLIEVEIWGDRILAADLGDEVADWFHRYLDLPSDRVCRLVRQSPKYTRYLARNGDSKAQPMNLADSFPIMLTTTASLAELNQRIVEIHLSQSKTIKMNRFRPNIAIETNEPFAEDSWSLIQIGNVRFEIVKPSSPLHYC